MKLASYILDGRMSFGLVEGGSLRPVADSFSAKFPTLREVLAAGALNELSESCVEIALSLKSLTLIPPIPTPGKILCVGLNYKKPYPVAGVSVQSDNIVIFGRHDDSLIGHGTRLEMPLGDAADSFDYEGEIVAVIGKLCRHVEPDQALTYVAGFSCMNEGSVRGWQKHSVHAGKNFAASGSWGPWLTAVDEAGAVEDMMLITRLNGEVVQTAMGTEMIHSLPKLLSYLSHIMPLNPGDVIATGSPDGTGGSRTPPKFLKPGDLIEVEVSTIGTLRNEVAAANT